MSFYNNRKIIVIFKILFICYLCIAIITLWRVYNCWVNEEIDNNNVYLNSKLETELGTHVAGRDFFINVNGTMRNILGINIMNGVVKLNNGSLSFTNSFTEDEILKNDADKLAHFSQYLDDKGISLLFVSTPFKIAEEETLIPIDALGRDYTNQNINRFLSYLDEQNVNYIDIRKEFISDNLDQYDYFFRTDHHWNMHGGFYAYTCIENWVTEKLNCKVDSNISDLSSYRIDTYRRYHLGSAGLRTGTAFANGADDFDVFVPQFDISLTKPDGTEITDFLDYYNKGELNKISYASSFYDRFLFGTTISYTNNNSLNNKKILVICDSMGEVVYPFMTLGFGSVQCIWNNAVDQITEEYIEECQPDAVIMIYYPTSLREDASDCFNFGICNE